MNTGVYSSGDEIFGTWLEIRHALEVGSLSAPIVRIIRDIKVAELRETLDSYVEQSQLSRSQVQEILSVPRSHDALLAYHVDDRRFHLDAACFGNGVEVEPTQFSHYGKVENGLHVVHENGRPHVVQLKPKEYLLATNRHGQRLALLVPLGHPEYMGRKSFFGTKSTVDDALVHLEPASIQRVA